MKSDSFDPSETESSTSERTSVEGERRTEEEEEGVEGTRGEMWRRRGCCHHPKSKLANSAQPPSNQRWVLEMARTQKMVIGE